jgi:hypothetical protein
VVSATTSRKKSIQKKGWLESHSMLRESLGGNLGRSEVIVVPTAVSLLQKKAGANALDPALSHDDDSVCHLVSLANKSSTNTHRSMGFTETKTPAGP